MLRFCVTSSAVASAAGQVAPPREGPSVNRVSPPCALGNRVSPIHPSEFTRSSHAASHTVRSSQLCTPSRVPRQPPAPAELRRTPLQLHSLPHAPPHNYQLTIALRANRHARCRRPCSVAVARKPGCDPRVSVKVLLGSCEDYCQARPTPHVPSMYTHPHCCSSIYIVKPGGGPCCCRSAS